VLSGTLGLTVDGEQLLLEAGGTRSWSSPARGIYRATRATASCGSLAEMRPAGRFEEFLADITAVNNTQREVLPYLLRATRVINEGRPA
jgi:hypothetical protein